SRRRLMIRFVNLFCFLLGFHIVLTVKYRLQRKLSVIGTFRYTSSKRLCPDHEQYMKLLHL
ncbi:MAG: hypothetical protein RSD19_07085, partial [Oscillospiraceae bacterium]